MTSLIKTLISVTAIIFSLSALSPTARAVIPPPDGGYVEQNTAEGEDALRFNTFGTSNTAIGYHALFNNTEGNSNTATGALALHLNITGLRNTATGFGALEDNNGNENTANGNSALENNRTGTQNPAASIRPTVFLHSDLTQPVVATRPAVLMRS